MFVGKYNNSIDSKSRVIVPAKFRDELERQMHHSESSGQVPDHLYAGAVGKVCRGETGDPSCRTTLRPESSRDTFYSSAAECDVDKQGRLTIPQELKEYAGYRKRAGDCRKRQDYRSVEQGALGR